MRITAEKETILSALSFVSKYASSSRSIPILADVLLVADGSSVEATATDIDRAAKTGFAAAIERNGSCCLPAQMLCSAIDGATGSEVVIDADDRQAAVSCGRQRYTLPVLPSIDFPEMKMLETEGETLTLPASLLKSLTKEISFAAESARGRAFLVGMSWRSSKGKLEFCSADGRRLAWRSIPSRIDIDANVPIFELPLWEGDISVAISSGFIRFTSGNQVVASKLIEARFPDIHPMIPKGPQRLLFDRQELAAAIKRVTLVSDLRETSVMLVGRDGIATLSARGMEAEATDEVRFEGDDFEAAFLRNNIASVLASFESENIEIRYTDRATAITFHDPNDADRFGFAMPYLDPRLVSIPERKQAA